MPRPRLEDRKSVTLTHVRISPNTKALLLDLQHRNNFKSIDAVLQYYLNEKAITSYANFHKASELHRLTNNGLFRGQSDAAYRIVKSNERGQPKSKPVHKQTASWQRKKSL